MGERSSSTMGWDSDSEDEWDAPVVKKPVGAKTTWEDDDDESEEEIAVVASQPKNEAKANPLKSKNKSKKAVLASGKNSSAAEEPCLDPAEEKLRLQKLVEDGDLALTEDLFGGGPAEEGSASNPKTKVEFEAFATIIGTKLREHEESVHYTTMLKQLLKTALEAAPSSSCKELASLCNTQSSEKQKAEKALAQKGKKKNTKVSIQKDHGGDFMDAGLSYGDDYDAVGFDDGDFM